MKRCLLILSLLIFFTSFSQPESYFKEHLPDAQLSTLHSLQKQEIINLRVLCQVWGFLKYFHPVVANGKFNWDKELFKKIPEIKSLVNNAELSSGLTSWINSLGEIDKCKKCDAEPGKNSFTQNIDLKWMEDASLNEELKQKLRYIFNNRHQGNGYYVRYNPGINNLDFTHEEKYESENTYPDLPYRLQFLFRYWNTIQYFFPYRYVIGSDWNKILEEYIPRFADAKDSIEYHIAITKLIASVNDSHAGINDAIIANEFGKYFLPVNFKIIDDQAVVSEYFNEALAAINNLQIGDIISKIDDKTIKQIIDERIVLASGSNYPRKLLTLKFRNFIAGGKDSSVRLQIFRNGKQYQITSKRYLFSTFNYKPVRDSTVWKMLDDNIGFVNMGLLNYKDVDRMMDELKNTKAIIFDIRNYPRGTFPMICNYLKKKSSGFSKITFPDLNYPGNFLWTKGSLLCGGGKSKFIYKGKTIILVNETTQSHAEWTTMAFQSVKNAVTIGSQTSGADGNVSTLTLTGNNITYMTGLGVFYPDQTPTQRVGVKINIEVKPTAKGIKEGRDEVLEKAIQVANQ